MKLCNHSLHKKPPQTGDVILKWEKMAIDSQLYHSHKTPKYPLDTLLSPKNPWQKEASSGPHFFPVTRVLETIAQMNFTMSEVARTEINNFSSAGWALAQIQLTWMDLFGVWFIYSQMRPNRAIFLLAILSVLKATNIIWFSLLFDYTPQYSDTLVTIILVGLDIGWYFNDHIASLSTLQKVNSLPQSRVKKAIWNTVMAISLVLGAYLRVARSQCRFNGKCDENWFLHYLDSIIAFNVIFTELFMVAVLLSFFYSIYKQSMLHSHVQVMSQMIEQGLLRVVILLPLGILEMVAYAIPNDPSSQGGFKDNHKALVKFLEVGIYARHLYPTFLAVAIAMTRLRVYKSTHSQSIVSQTKSHDY
jgi:hypothetical protein